MVETISSIKHPVFREASVLTRPSGRAAVQQYLLEDRELVEQALAAVDCPVIAVFALPESVALLEPRCRARAVKLYALGQGLIQKLVGTSYETAVEAIAIVGQLPADPMTWVRERGLILCGERIQDPRNVGVLIRTAEAAGCNGVLLSTDSAEPWSRAAVRSTTGSIVRIPIAFVPQLPEWIAQMKQAGAVAIASSGAAQLFAAEYDFQQRPLIITVGNEQSGISTLLSITTDVVVKLPMPGKADSYNVTVAAGMLLYEAIRGR